MSNLKRYLDLNNNSPIVIKYPLINNRTNMKKTISSINKNFILYNTDPITNNIINNSYIPRKLIIKKEFVIINCEINSIEDLIQLCDKYPITSNIEYNIDIFKIHRIKEPLIELNNMIGIHDVKNNILDQILFYMQNLHLNSGIDYMHTVLYGPPGTGKTEIAKKIGKIFSKLGILKNGTFRKVVRTDLVAGYLGQTAIKTSKVIDEAIGGVLFIDEAYSLGNSEKRDSFSKECIDTICEALSDRKDELMVIIAGYEEELNSCFFNYNPGLKSRFPWIFNTNKYNAIDLKNIFIKKVKDINWQIDYDVDINFFEDNIDLFPYYGRDMEILLLKTKIVHGRRVFCKDKNIKTIINKEDLENGLELFKKHTNQPEKNTPNIYSMYN